MQRYVVVLADENGQVVEPSQNIATKVANLQSAKPSRNSPSRRKRRKKNSSSKPKVNLPSLDASALSDAANVVSSAASLLGDNTTAADTSLVQNSNQSGSDPVGLLADTAPAIGGAIGSIVPGVGTAVGVGIGTAVSLAAKLLD